MKSHLFFVLGQAFDRETGKPVGSQREELINIKENKMFKGCKNILDIKESYESFWNHLNKRSRDVVFVQSIREPFGWERELVSTKQILKFIRDKKLRKEKKK